MSAWPIETQVGELWGRDCIYIDSEKSFDDSTFELSGGLNTSLIDVSKLPKAAKLKRGIVRFRLSFKNAVATKREDLDDWVANGGGWMLSIGAFWKLNDSKWQEQFAETTNHPIQHFVIQTYDHVFEFLCENYEFKLG